MVELWDELGQCSTFELPITFEENIYSSHTLFSLSLSRLLSNSLSVVFSFPFFAHSVPFLLSPSSSPLLFNFSHASCSSSVPLILLSSTISLIPACLSLSISPRAAISSPSAIPCHFNALSVLHIIICSFLSIIPFIPLSALSGMMSANTRPYPQPHSFFNVCDPHSFSASLLLLCICSVCASTLIPAPSALLYRFSCLSLLSAHNGDLLLFLEEMIKKSIWQKVCKDGKKN